jgi:2-succinyl-5-enolpyruvyl-6-hydroxy-3-cyclohexene-1-carboxylate synthase
MSFSVATAALVVDELMRCGMRDAVLAPGSRSAPIAYALAAAEQAGSIRLHVRIDERSAAFLALGLAKRSGRPVAVTCTSGTATANFHPAVLEAAESGIPLVVLTADRPPELRGVGANQTVDQAALYGPAVRAYQELGDGGGQTGAYVRSTVDRLVDAATGALTGNPGPAQLNLPLRAPLVPSDVAEPLPVGRDGGLPWTTVAPRPQTPGPLSAEGGRTLVVVGDAPAELGGRARRWAEAAGWPMIAEPSSGARGGPMAVPAASLLLAVSGFVDALLPERVLVVGRPTLARSVSALLQRDDVDIEIRSASSRWPDAGRRASRVELGLPAPPETRRTPSAWTRRWLDAGAAAAEARDHVLATAARNGTALPGPCVAREVAAAAAGGLLVAGSSLPIRDLDVAVDDLNELPVLANRGVAGIDGTVSTAVGVALAAGGSPAYALLGDLTFLHDANGLVLGPDEPRADLCLVVVDNDGGGIFSTLEHGSGSRRTFDRIFGTPHGVDLGALCAASSTPYAKAGTLAALREALEPREGLRVVHVPIGRHSLPDDGARLSAAVTAAVTPLLK